MRKRFVLLLVAIIIVGGIPMDSFGESLYDKELEKAIITVKDLFSISNNYDSFDSQVNTSGNQVYFYLNWSDSNKKLDSINITTDNQGNISSYHKYNQIYVEAETKSPSYSREEALEKANSFIKRIASDLSNEIQLKEDRYPISPNDNNYSFNFIRVINEIPYPDNTVSISVNKLTGEVTNFYTNWERTLSFPSPDRILTLEEGKGAFKERIGLELIYKSSNRLFRNLDTNQDTKYFLTYSILNQGKVIDAITGDAINVNHYGGMGVENEKAMDSEVSSITPKERAEIDKLVGIIDQEQIEKTAREILSLGDDYILQSKNLYSSYKNPGDFQWSLYFTKRIDASYVLVADIILNAKTSELLSFSKNNRVDSNDDPTITKAESLEFARDFIKEQQAKKLGNIEYIDDYIDNTNENKATYYFRFMRKTDDIYIESDGIYVGVDAVSKEIISYNLDWYNGNLPPKGTLIGHDKAYDILFNDVGYELSYITIYNYDKPEGENKEIKLVYSLNREKPAIIHANTGEILNYSGDVYKDISSINYTDIESSYAKDKISTLAQYGVGFNSEKFKPEEKIKQKDFIYLLFKSINSYRTETEEDIDKIYDELINSRIIRDQERNPEKIVSKEEAVKFVIRAMNYGKIAEISEIYDDIFIDSANITPELKGYINIAYGLGIINGNEIKGNKINPKAELKRQDAANIIYNYMFN